MPNEPRSREFSPHVAMLRIAAAIIVDERRRLLLVRKHGSRWFMQAGGKIDPGETPVAALRRELAEELRVETLSTELIGIVTADAANEANHRVHAHLFWAEIQGIAEATAEIEEACWVTLDEAAVLPLAPLTRETVIPAVRVRFGIDILPG